MKWIARVLVFTTALIFGTFAASLFWSQESGLSNCTVTIAPAQKPPLRAENLLGTWKGSWRHDDGSCTIVIDRVEGNAFYGTLRKEGAEILFEGTFNPKTRTFYFDETEIVRLGDHMSGWSLGKNGGLISQDGRILVGDGHDQWGQYGWAASNY